jgi:hypothetical protein
VTPAQLARELAREHLARADEELADAVAYLRLQPTDDAFSQVASAWHLREAAAAVLRLVTKPPPKGVTT